MCCQPAAVELQPVYPASVDRLTPSPSQPPSRAQTVTNNLALVTGAPGAVKDTNVRGAGSMEGVETVRVTDMTSSSAFTKSIGSIFSSINKSVSSAFNSLMAVPAPAAGGAGSGDVVKTTAATPTQPDVVPVVAQQHTELDMTSAGAQQQQQRQQEMPRDDRLYQQVDLPDWRRVQPQFYAEPSAFRGKTLLTSTESLDYYRWFA